jgi:hypothetical protein
VGGPLATLVEWDKLLKVVEAALVAGVGIAILFSLVIYGAGRGQDFRRQGRSLAAGSLAVLAALALAATGVMVVYGFKVMIQGSPKPSSPAKK